MSLLRGLLAEFEHEASNTRRLLERVPGDRLSWKPHDKSMTLARLAGHVAEIPAWGQMILRGDHYDLDGGDYDPFEPSDTTSLMEKFEAQVSSFLAAANAISDDDLFVPWQLRKSGSVLSEMPRVAAARGFIFNHTVHHRGQLTVYLRLLEVPLPALYGNSADESNF